MRRAFTIVELLVVMLIIALLMSFLVHGLSAARESAINAACKARMHDEAVAWVVYADSYRRSPVAGLWTDAQSCPLNSVLVYPFTETSGPVHLRSVLDHSLTQIVWDGHYLHGWPNGGYANASHVDGSVALLH